MEEEAKQLNDLLSAVNAQLISIAELTEAIAKWPDSEHKSKLLNNAIAEQQRFLNESQKIIQRLKQLGALP